MNVMKDNSFLRKLDIDNNKVFYVKILVLDKNEMPINAIEGRVSAGSISIDGSSSVRRSGSITFLAEEKDNDLTDVDNLLSTNKKVKILVGIENNIDKNYDKIIWFQQGIFVITNPSLSHTTTGVTINLQLKDKMALLNGECGGGLPACVTFNQYGQIIIKDDTELSEYPDNPLTYIIYNVKGRNCLWDGKKWTYAMESEVGGYVNVEQKIFDIIQTMVCNYGGEDIAKIIIEDVPTELKQRLRYIGADTLFFNPESAEYQIAKYSPGEDWVPYIYNEDCGYTYVDFVYPGELTSSIGENVCSVLDKIIELLGNYEYFYDIEGNFIFREKKNYLNTQYEPVQKLDEQGFILNEENYYVDFSNNAPSVYTFEEGSALISSYSNTPNYNNIKNDYHIWGKNQDGYAIHYHVAIKEKPVMEGSWQVVDILDKAGEPTGKIRLAVGNEKGYEYIPEDWRAQLYMQGLEKKSLQLRPDVYEQELLDLFDDIYNMKEKKFKTDIINTPNDLNYWFDYLEPLGELHDISVDAIGSRVHSYQQDNINRLYLKDNINYVIINSGDPFPQQEYLINKCEQIGQNYTSVKEEIYNSLAPTVVGYAAQEVARDLLYQYTDFTAGISISSIPIYYLDVNSRITVNDRASGIYGDYVIKNINLPFDGKSNMSISATRALVKS